MTAPVSVSAGNIKMTKQEEQELREMERHVVEVNSRIVPETPGYVRHDGPRRQYRAEVVNGRLVYTEI